jgi:aminoglycoside 6-adenylyltransferase
VAKGLWRDELTYAKTMMDGVVRDEQLIKMLVWYFGIKTDFKKSPGKLGKYIKADIEPEIWAELESVYCDANFENIWKSLFAMCNLFRKLARSVAAHFNFEYNQQEDDNVTEYLHRIRNMPRGTGV